MRYRLMLLTASLIWGSSFVMVKDITGVVSPAWLIACRFAAATAIMVAATWRKRRLWLDPAYVRCALVLGLFYSAAWYTQTVGITFTTPGKNAFLTATYCVIVPFALWALFKRKPAGMSFIAAGLAVVGIGLITLDAGFSINVGDVLTLICAVFYALQIVFFDRYVEGRDALVLIGMQFAVTGAINLVLALATEPVPAWASLHVLDWASLAYLTVFCTTIALVLQGVGQKHLPASTAALLLSLESVFGAAFSVALGAEVLTARIVAGFIIVFAAVVVSELGPAWLAGRRMARSEATRLG